MISICTTLALPGRVVAQGIVEISGDACRGCGISSTRVASLGDADAGIVSHSFTIQRDQRGNYLVAYETNGAELLVFDSAGRHIRSFGRPGSGPGEFRWIDKLATRRNQIHTFDTFLARRTAFTSDFEVLYTTPLPAQALSVLLLNDSVTVITSHIRSRQHVGLPVHALDKDGNIVRSFGDEPAEYRSDLTFTQMRSLAGIDDNSFWSAFKTQYRIDRWRLDGARLTSIVRRADWFKPYVANGPRVDHRVPPDPSIQGIWHDRDGRLWVLIDVADRQWHRAIAPAPGPHGLYRETEKWSEFFDTVVEVIDPVSGRVLASQRFDERFWAFIDDGLVASYRQVGPDGAPRIDIWRLTLTQTRGR